MIEIKGLRKSFGDQLIFDDLNIDIDRCGLYGIVGSSGSGKSTLLNMIFKMSLVMKEASLLMARWR